MDGWDDRLRRVYETPAEEQTALRRPPHPRTFRPSRAFLKAVLFTLLSFIWMTNPLKGVATPTAKEQRSGLHSWEVDQGNHARHRIDRPRVGKQ